MDEKNGRNGKDEQVDVDLDVKKIKKYIIPVHKVLNKTWWFICLLLVIGMFVYLDQNSPDPIPGFDEYGMPKQGAFLALGSDASPYFNIEEHFTKICKDVNTSLMNIMIAFLILFMLKDMTEFIINGWGEKLDPKTKRFVSFCFVILTAMVDMFMKFTVCAYIILYWGA